MTIAPPSGVIQGMRALLLLAPLLLGGCADRVVLPGTGPGEFELGVGDRAVFRGYAVEVRFEGVTADSRCPIDVTCVSPGDAAALVRLTSPGTEPGTVTLHSTLGPDSATAGALVFTLVGVAPLPREGVVIDPSEYRIRLRAEER